MNDRSQDDRSIDRALELARKGVGLASPNPCVGAVVVSGSGEVVGEGWHTYTGKKHAEILALESAGEKAGGGTLYLNLEPCSHYGRTDPCVDAVIASGIKRVVASMPDPNPAVAGRGFQKLRGAGVVVETGARAEQAMKLNEAFAKFITTHAPFVTLKAGMTLDGKLAPAKGVAPGNPTALGTSTAARGWITSEEARAHVQDLRHASDAILVGLGTVIADDPKLTDRSGEARRRPLLRVILDSHLRLPLDSNVVKSAKDDLMVFCVAGDATRERELRSRGVRIERLPPSANGQADLGHMLKRLGELEIISLLIEGGAAVNWAALSVGIVDKVFLYYAPKILGGIGAIPFAGGEGFQHITEAAQVKDITIHRFAEDFAVEGYLRDPYQVQATTGQSRSSSKETPQSGSDIYIGV